MGKGGEVTKSAKKQYKKENKKEVKKQLQTSLKSKLQSQLAPKGKPVSDNKPMKNQTGSSKKVGGGFKKSSNNGKPSTSKKPFVKKSTGSSSNSTGKANNGGEQKAFKGKKTFTKPSGGKDFKGKSKPQAVIVRKKPNSQLVSVLKEQWNSLRSMTRKSARNGRSSTSADENEEEDDEENDMEVESGSDEDDEEGDEEGDESENEDMSVDDDDDEEEEPMSKTTAVGKKAPVNSVVGKQEAAAATAAEVKSAADTALLVNTLMNDIKDRILDVTLRHDASRIVQSIIQFGSKEQRGIIMKELCTKAVDVCKAPYGHFTILKALAYCKEPNELNGLLHSLQRHYLSLGCNAIGARVIESLLASDFISNEAKCKYINSEFYGLKYTTLLPTGVVADSLLTVIQHIVISPPLANQSANNKAHEGKYFNILDHMQEIIHRFINKGLFEFSYVHQFIYEYMMELQKMDPNYKHMTGNLHGESIETTPWIHTSDYLQKNFRIPQEFTKRMNDMLEVLKDHLPSLMSSKSGCKVVLIAINYLVVKDRKDFMRKLKGKVVASIIHPSAHLVIMKLIDVVDDKVELQKNIFKELLSTSADEDAGTVIEQRTALGDKIVTECPLITVMKNAYGRKVLLHTLSPFKSMDVLGKNNMIEYLEPSEYEFFQVEVGISKKAAALRVKENLALLRNSELTAVFEDIDTVQDCMFDAFASKVMIQLITVFQPARLCENILSLAQNNEVYEDGSSFLEDYNVHKVVQACIQVQHTAYALQQEEEKEAYRTMTQYWPDVKDSKVIFDFITPLADQLAGDQETLKYWLSVNRLSFILVDLLKSKDGKANIQSTLGQAIARLLQPAAAPSGSNKVKGTPKKAKAAAVETVAPLCTNKSLVSLFQ